MAMNLSLIEDFGNDLNKGHGLKYSIIHWLWQPQMGFHQRIS